MCGSVWSCAVVSGCGGYVKFGMVWGGPLWSGVVLCGPLWFREVSRCLAWLGWSCAVCRGIVRWCGVFGLGRIVGAELSIIITGNGISGSASIIMIAIVIIDIMKNRRSEVSRCKLACR